MSAMVPEFSRQVALAQLGAGPFRQRIEATAEERQKLSRRFGLIALDRLVAEVVLRRQSPEVVLLEAEFSADFEQCCTVSLEPLRGTVSDRFSLIYGPPAGGETDIAFSEDEPVYEPVKDSMIDIGEAVAQELSLTLPLFPRHPDATIDQAAVAEPLKGAFSVLARLSEEPEC